MYNFDSRKNKTRGRKKFYKYKKIIEFISIIISLFPFKIRLKFFETTRMIKGNKGLAIRYAIIKTLAKHCGNNVSIYPNVYLFNPQYLSLGDNVSIHPMCYFECGNNGEGGIIIGNDVSIAHGVSIISNTHKYSDLNIPIKDQGMEEKTVEINNNVWIGAKATILSGITIGSGSIIGANSVVTKNFENNLILAGVPAKVIKTRL